MQRAATLSYVTDNRRITRGLQTGSIRNPEVPPGANKWVFEPAGPGPVSADTGAEDFKKQKRPAVFEPARYPATPPTNRRHDSRDGSACPSGTAKLPVWVGRLRRPVWLGWVPGSPYEIIPHTVGTEVNCVACGLRSWRFLAQRNATRNWGPSKRGDLA